MDLQILVNKIAKPSNGKKIPERQISTQSNSASCNVIMPQIPQGDLYSTSIIQVNLFY